VFAAEKLLIDWPLTPYTGWGSYGIQLVQALLAGHWARPVLTCKADRSPHCEPHWLLRLDEVERYSQGLIDCLCTKPAGVVDTNCSVVLEPLGNRVPPERIRGKHQVGITFFERSAIDASYLQGLDRLDLVITGSRWNQRVLETGGCKHARLVHQGIDCSRFNPTPTPRLLDRPFVLFAGGKLEARKGQDVVIAAFRNFLRHCPDALLIACWGNLGNVGLETIAQSQHVEGSPTNGDAMALHTWLIQQGIPSRNLMVPSVMANAQLPGLFKQADAAVFASRCEGGTNLMAMEALACAIPTVLSANTGHLDLLELELGHAVAVGQQGVGHVPPAIARGYGGDDSGLWGETDPMVVEETLLRLWKERNDWRHRAYKEAHRMESFSWTRSMDELLSILVERQLLNNNRKGSFSDCS